MKKLNLIASFALLMSIATVQPATPTLSSFVVSMYTGAIKAICDNPWASAALGVTALAVSAAALSHKPYKVLVYKNHSVADKNGTECRSFRTKWGMDRYINAVLKNTPAVQIQWSYKGLRKQETGNVTLSGQLTTPTPVWTVHKMTPAEIKAFDTEMSQFVTEQQAFFTDIASGKRNFFNLK